MNRRWAWVLLAIATGCGAAVPPGDIPDVETDRLNETWWAARHKIKRELKGYRVAFVGDSITQGWEDAGRHFWTNTLAEFKAENFGYSGDRTPHVLWRFAHGEVLPQKPEVIVLMIGTNNVGHKVNTPAETVVGIRQILARIHRDTPETKVLLLAVFPRGTQPDDPMRKAVVEINEQLAKISHPKVTYRDYGSSFTNPGGTLKGELMPDALHLNEAGYQVWAERLLPDLRRLLGTR